MSVTLTSMHSTHTRHTLKLSHVSMGLSPLCVHRFQVATLKLCCALCTHSYGDSRVVRQVQLVLGQEQLMHVLQGEGVWV